MRGHEIAQTEPQGFHKAIDGDGDPYQYIIRPGGRHLVVHTKGSREYPAFFYLHGSPGWGGGPMPRPAKLETDRMYMIAPTRPAYYCSDEQPDRTFADTADDIAAIAKELGIDKYYVIGRSIGGLHALATLSRNGDAVLGAALLGSMAPPETLDPAMWTDGMIRGNAKLLEMSDQKVIDDFRELGRLAAFENDDFRKVPPDLSERARDEIRRQSIAPLLQTAYRKAYGKDGMGWPYDILALKRGMGDLLKNIDGQKVLLYYNTEDQYTPLQHGHTLHRLLPGSQLYVNYGLVNNDYRESLKREDPQSLFLENYDTHFGGFNNLFFAAAKLKTNNR
ncbi:MAG TPA: alpha/beta fold hydrolase [Candidatus Saccharimonadales bacterium]|nr:alpha/beta fold hydrolase [Candidatus Saccharimonadales bacterium]